LSKRGIINTFTQEYYYPTPEPPVTMAVIDLDGGGRILAQMTDTDPKSVSIGLPVELTFRRLHQGGEFLNYCWKCRPIGKSVKASGGES
ncbi:MAG: OB-fold domain-containing protein, partial [Thermoplasmata archaeon]